MGVDGQESGVHCHCERQRGNLICRTNTYILSGRSPTPKSDKYGYPAWYFKCMIRLRALVQYWSLWFHDLIPMAYRDQRAIKYY